MTFSTHKEEQGFLPAGGWEWKHGGILCVQGSNRVDLQVYLHHLCFFLCTVSTTTPIQLQHASALRPRTAKVTRASQKAAFHVQAGLWHQHETHPTSQNSTLLLKTSQGSSQRRVEGPPPWESFTLLSVGLISSHTKTITGKALHCGLSWNLIKSEKKRKEGENWLIRNRAK